MLSVYLCSGSPFHPKVVSPRRVHIVGGWDSILDGNNQMKLKLNEMKTVEFDTRAAGPGTPYSVVYTVYPCFLIRF